MSPFENEPTEREYRMAQDEIREQSDAEWRATEALLNQHAVVVERPASMVRAAIGDVTDAIVEYTRIKDALDKALPDCIQTIQGKQFRKKNYWRAIGTAFNLTLEIRQEQLDQTDAGWGYLVTYRATAPNGRFADGDGACYASEKNDKQATVHNVRSHAHTRAMNRAISNLVGFGEVSAEEINIESTGRGGSYKADVRPRDRSQGVEGATPRPVNSPQPNATEHGLPLTDTMLALPYLDETLGFGKHKDVTWRQMCGGGLASGRISYLEWLLKQEIKGERQQATHDKAREVCRLVEEREMSQARAAQDAGDDPAWDAEPRLPGETR